MALEQGAVRLGDHGLEVRVGLVGAEGWPVGRGNRLVENPGITPDPDVVGGRVRQPDPVVGDLCAPASGAI
jgi:hypothetical protein